MQTKPTKKRKLWLIITIIAGVLIIFAATVLLTNFYVNNPTKGTAISQYDAPKSALLVIDVQNDTANNTSFYGDTTEFVNNINQAVESAKQNEMEILYVKNEYGNNPLIALLSGGKYKKGTAGAELDSRLQVINENVYSKSIGDSFSSKDLEEYLISKEVDTLYIVGADAAACVNSTALGGINRKYNVNIIKDAIITVNDATMKTMLEKYNSNGIEVIDLAEFKELTTYGE